MDALATTTTPHPAAPGRYRRRQYLIDPAMQGRFFLTMLLVAAAIVCGMVLLAAHYFLQVTAPGDVLTAAEIKAHLLRVALLGSLVAVLAVPLLSLILSHRIAGPAWRLRKAAREVAAGDFSGSIHLREHDYLKSTAEAFNAMTAALNAREAAREAQRESARAALHRATQVLATGDDLAVPEALRLLEEAAAGLR